jgi:hypothetical protein
VDRLILHCQGQFDYSENNTNVSTVSNTFSPQQILLDDENVLMIL